MYLKSFLSFLFLLFSSAAAMNITEVLGEHDEFSKLNSYITDTQLAGEINGRQTITILAVDNDGLSSLSGKPKDVIKKVLSLHVLLDYFDLQKLQKLPNKTQVLPTLFQASGQATGQIGFVNITDLSSGEVAFGSAVDGSPLSANLVKSVVSRPFNLSVLQISSAIIPSGINNSSTNSSTSPPAPSPAPSPAPEPSPSNTSSPASPPAKAPAPVSSPPPKASSPSPTKRPFLGPVADMAPAVSPKGSRKGDEESSAPATVGIHLAIVIMLVSSLWSLTFWI